MKTILILGGGIGGIVSANELRKALPSNHKIILIEKNPIHSFAPSFIWLMTGARKISDIQVKLEKLLLPGIELIISEVNNIDVSNKTIKAGNKIFSFDYLIIALGTELNPESIPGLTSATNTFYTLEGSLKIYEDLSNFKGGSIAVVVCSLPYKCPGAPHEGSLLISDYYRKKGMRDKVTINFYTPESQPMPVAGPELGSAVEDLIKSKNIAFNPIHKLKSVDNENRLLFFENKEPVNYDLLIIIPPHRSPAVLKESALANESGWLPVDINTLESKYDNVFAIGDVTSISIPGRWKKDIPMNLPKAGVFAHSQAETVAKIISDRIAGNNSASKFEGFGYCMIEAGNGESGFAYGNFYGEPNPIIHLSNVKRRWHLGKVLFEKWWLTPIGLKRSFYQYLLKISVKILRIPINI
ncbi:MAG: FAD-dependent pyridine nucleotide-disulfide oxidoreductase [Ignavibacteria bacterium]|nr:FAD-dependent pyridine nucleotide-disulfide oxidoreductase [Ignavibacteria bacterium]